MARNKDLSSDTHQSILVLRNEGYSMREIANWYNAVYYSLHRTAQTGYNQNRKRSGRPWGTTEQEDKYIRVSRRPASRGRLVTVDVETGVLRVLLNEAAN